jgi:uncharacterized protein YbjT (DUF2867 family)
MLGKAAEIVEGDLVDRETVKRILHGVERIVIAVSVGKQNIRHQRRVERDAVLMLLKEASSTTRVVYLCGYEIRHEISRDFETGRIMVEVQEALAESTLNWTALGCAPSMELFLATIHGENMTFPDGGPLAFPTVSKRDVGTIAAQAVLRDDLARQRFRVCGPEAMSFPEAAQRISAVTGRPLQFRAIPLTPLRIAAFLVRPFHPYFYFIITAATMLNRFPQDLVADIPADHLRLTETFDYEPQTLEMEAQRWFLGEAREEPALTSL